MDKYLVRLSKAPSKAGGKRGRKVQTTIPSLKKVVVTSDVEALKEFLELSIHADDLRDGLRRLDEMPMSLEVLERTKIGRAVARLKHNPDEAVSREAKRILKGWKNVAREGLVVRTRLEKSREGRSGSRSANKRARVIGGAATMSGNKEEQGAAVGTTARRGGRWTNQ